MTFRAHHVRLDLTRPQAAASSREAAITALKNEIKRKLPLVDAIRSAPGCRFGEDELLAMSEPELRKMVAIAASARPAPAQRAYSLEDDYAPCRATPGWEAKRPDRGIWGPPPGFADDGDDDRERERAVRAALAEVNQSPAPELMPAALGAADDGDYAPLPKSTWTGTRT
jgi:hypothetical protein